MPRDYRQLLPAPERAETRSTSESTSSVPETPEEPAKRRRVGVTVACNLCRAKKTRCDGARPVCNVCKKRGVEKCVYIDKREASEETIEIMDLLKLSTESAAIDILRLLRQTGDPAVVLALLRRDSEERLSSIVDGYTSDRLMIDRSSLETELMMKNAVSYPVLQPLSQSTLEESDLLRSVNLIQSEPKEHRISSQSRDTMKANRSASVLDNDIDPDSALQRFRDTTSSKRTPPEKTKYCDDRLSELDISYWTDIRIPNHLAAKIISLYLETDHPLLGTFDPEQFVPDLVNHQETSCSKFLVNTLLYWGSQAYSAVHKGANEYSQPLCKEAERLWSTVKDHDSILNMIGAQMLSLAYMGNGKDHDVFVYLAESIRMGMRLGLFGLDDNAAAAKLSEIPEAMKHAYSFAAWGVFNWSMQITIFYRQPGLIYPKYPPTLPIPGDSGRVGSPSAVSEYMATRCKLPPYMGNTFPLICEFWEIIREVSLAYFSSQEDPKDSVSLDFAEMKFRELLAWAETIPMPVIRDVQSPHHVMVFHMWIHSAILDIFRPFVERGKTEKLRLKTFSAAESTPATAYAASVSQLKRLIFDYRSSYEASAYTILWQTALSYVATAVLRNTEDPTWRPWLLLCIYGYETLRRPFRISEAIGQGLLTMTMRDTNINSTDARKLMSDLRERGLNHIPGEVRATFMGDLALAASNPEGARVETLAKEFDEMAFFREYTNGDDAEMT